MQHAVQHVGFENMLRASELDATPKEAPSTLCSCSRKRNVRPKKLHFFTPCYCCTWRRSYGCSWACEACKQQTCTASAADSETRPKRADGKRQSPKHRITQLACNNLLPKGLLRPHPTVLEPVVQTALFFESTILCNDTRLPCYTTHYTRSEVRFLKLWFE